MSLPDEYLRIETPENVAFDYEVAGIGSRFLAALVDTALIVVLQLIVYAVILAVGSGSNVLSKWLPAILGLLAFFFLWGYYVFFELLWNGQSPGKRLAGLRVIRTDGTPVTMTESLVRNLVRLVDFLPLLYGAGVVAMFINEQSRRLGDLAAGTLVVHDRAMVSLASLDSPAALGPLPGAEGLVLPVNRLSPSDIQLAEAFIQRRQHLFNRPEIATRISRALLKQMAIPEEEMAGVLPEDLIVAALAASRKKDQGILPEVQLPG
jgi:uncharacterized RDD family membrane protein YckC